MDMASTRSDQNKRSPIRVFGDRALPTPCIEQRSPNCRVRSLTADGGEGAVSIFSPGSVFLPLFGPSLIL